MKRLISGLALAGALFAPTMAYAKAPTPASDQVLEKRIEHRIDTSKSLKREHISVSVKDHVATLSGSVNSRANKRRAEQMARIAGIRRVNDSITVETRRATSGTIGDKSATAVDRTKAGTRKVVESTKHGVSKTGEVVDDGWITSKVKTQFIGEDALKHSDINVDTSNHVVTLKGTVASPAGRERALAIAKGTKGVNRVIDRLTIAPSK